MIDKFAWVLCIIFFVVGIVFIIKYVIIKVNIKSFIKRAKIMNENETNLLIDSSSNDKDVLELAHLYNQSIHYLNDVRKKIVEEEKELRKTFTNVSHDLRTPMTAISGYIDLLNADNLTDQQKEYVNIIKERLIVIRDLVEQLFSYSLIYDIEEEPNFEKINASSVLENAVVLYYDEFVKHGLEVNFNKSENDLYFILDKQMLARVYMNILNNISKYGVKEITITEAGNKVTFKNKTVNIDSIDIKKLFDRFYTVGKNRVGQSTGLGLAIAKALIEKMNGSISADVKDDYLVFEIFFKV